MIKKNKIQPCVLVIKYRYRIQEPEKAYKQNVSLSKRKKKNLHNILGVSVLGPVGTRPDRLKPVGTRSD